jgi:GntR family transcriptional regulator
MPYLDPGGGNAWEQEAEAQGHVGAQRIVSAGELTPPPDVAAALHLRPGEVAVGRRRLMLLGEQPVELVTSYWPTDIAGGTALAELRKIPGGSVALLSRLGHTPQAVEERVRARAPGPHERHELRLADGEWVLVLDRLITNRDGRPYEVSVMIMSGRLAQLRYSMKVDRDGE